MLPLLIIAALLVPPRGPLDPPGACVAGPSGEVDAQISIPSGADWTRWRLWASEPAITATTDAYGMTVDATLTLTQSLEIGPGSGVVTAVTIAYPHPPFTLYACAPGDLPPGGGWRTFAPDVRG